jgi:hypothetical protein
MKITEAQELADLLETNGTAPLILEAIKLRGLEYSINIYSDYECEERCLQHCQRFEWNPDTTLALRIEKKPEDEDGLSMFFTNGKSQYIVLFFKDMTLEKLATTINQIIKMKAFL